MIRKSSYCTAEVCGLIFSKKKDLLKHFKQAHESIQDTCSICDKKFNSRRNYIRHIQLHSNRPSKRCDECGLTFTNNSNLRRHESQKHSNYKHAKQILLELVFNMKEPIGDNSAKAPTNNGLMVLRPTLEGEIEEGVHLIPEDGPRGENFACDDCGKKFGTSFNLKRHNRSFHTSKETMCPHRFCQKIFSDKFMMIKHKQTCYKHCPWENCDLKFTRIKLFKKHQSGHELKMRRLL